MNKKLVFDQNYEQKLWFIRVRAMLDGDLMELPWAERAT